MKKSLMLCAALAVACLAGMSAASAQPVDPAPAFRMQSAAADTRAQSVQTVKVTQGESLAVVLFATPLASKPALGGYPGAVLLQHGTFGQPLILRPQPGYRT